MTQTIAESVLPLKQAAEDRARAVGQRMLPDWAHDAHRMTSQEIHVRLKWRALLTLSAICMVPTAESGAQYSYVPSPPPCPAPPPNRPAPAS